MPTIPAFLSARAMRILNVGVAVWAAFWIALAAYTAYEVNALRTLSNTVVKAGVASESAGKALSAVGAIPLVGSRVGALAQQTIAAGRSAQSSGASSKTTIDQLAVLLGIAIGLIPTLPLLGLYLPLVVGWRRDRRGVEQAVMRWHGERGLVEYLAGRARAHLPYHELRELTSESVDALAHDELLAAAELERLGLPRASHELLSTYTHDESFGPREHAR